MNGMDELARSKTGTVEWYDGERGVGSIRPDDDPSPCAVRLDALRACGIAALSAGDRVRFQIRDEVGDRTATDIARIRAIQRWENEGGAVAPDHPPASPSSTE